MRYLLRYLLRYLHALSSYMRYLHALPTALSTCAAFCATYMRYLLRYLLRYLHTLSMCAIFMRYLRALSACALYFIYKYINNHVFFYFYVYILLRQSPRSPGSLPRRLLLILHYVPSMFRYI